MPHTTFDNVADVGTYVSEHPEFQTCREFGHIMRPTHKGWILKTSGSARTLTKKYRCRDCGTRRIDEYSSVTFERIRRHYEYPDGYLLESGSGALPRWLVLQWDMENSVAVEEEPAPRKAKR